MSEQTLRTEMLLGSDALARLRRSRVAVLGLGGVGSWCAEALARAGVGALTLVDRTPSARATSTANAAHCIPRSACRRRR